MGVYFNISDDSFAKEFEHVGNIFSAFDGDIKEIQLLILTDVSFKFFLWYIEYQCYCNGPFFNSTSFKEYFAYRMSYGEITRRRIHQKETAPYRKCKQKKRFDYNKTYDTSLTKKQLTDN